MAFSNPTYNLQQAGPGFSYQNTTSARLGETAVWTMHAATQPLMSDPDVQTLKQQLKKYEDECAFF